MRRKRMTREVVLAALMSTVLLAVLSLSTFAWFTNNGQVGTSRISGKIGQDELGLSSGSIRLLMSTQGGDAFQGKTTCAIGQVNETDAEVLMPVSTANLQEFVYCPSTVNGYATKFSLVEDEGRYYHGRIYLKAEGTAADNGLHIKLYLDESEVSGGALAQKDDENSYVLNAARLGLRFSGGEAPILRLSDAENTTDRQINTKIDGKLLEDGQVLRWSDGKVQAVQDPSVLLTQYVAHPEQGTLPQQALATIEVNRIYQLDIYYYLEGCDADCVDSIAFDGNDLHLAFYGVIQ